MTIYLIRHGEIVQHHPRRFVGQLDLSLTDLGREQIRVVASALDGRGVARLACSPLPRCVESARIIGEALGLDAEIVDDLREISLGAWEGLTMDEVQDRYPGMHEARGRDLAGFRPPDGESFADVQGRAWAAFETVLASSGGNVAIVAHGGVNRALLCRILGMPLENLFRIGQDYGAINTIRATDAGFQVVTLNHCPRSQLRC